MLIYCIKCKSKKIREYVIENKVYYYCGSCHHRSGRAVIVDNKIRLIHTNRGIKHIAVAALIIKDNQILLIQRRTHPFGLELPAGHVEYEESLEEALERELYEELRLVCSNYTFLGQIEHPQSYCRYGSDVEVWAVFTVECQSSEGVVSNHELESYSWVPLKHMAVKSLTPPTIYALSIFGYLPYYQIKKCNS